MSVHPQLTRRGRAGVGLAAVLAVAALPGGALAAVNLGTAGSFVVLGGSTVTNTGPSVLNGDLGVAPGTALVGFGLPAVVNGATHAANGVAAQAQLDLTTAYDVAAAQPVPPGNVLAGDLGNRTLLPGAYRYTSSAGLTGRLTLDAQGDPAAEFVFEIGTTLTTASASSVLLVNGASPCNVFWQVGSSATLGTATAFQGNVLALTSISLNNGASVVGRVLARNGAVTLNNNVLDNRICAAGSTTPTPTTPTPPGAPGSTTPGAPGAAPTTPVKAPATARQGSATLRRSAIVGSARTVVRGTCTDGYGARVRGRRIQTVVFRLDGRRIAVARNSPFQVFVRAAPGRHALTARVTFTDATRARTLTLRYRACAAQVLEPRRGPARFTG